MLHGVPKCPTLVIHLPRKYILRYCKYVSYYWVNSTFQPWYSNSNNNIFLILKTPAIPVLPQLNIPATPHPAAHAVFCLGSIILLTTLTLIEKNWAGQREYNAVARLYSVYLLKSFSTVYIFELDEDTDYMLQLIKILKFYIGTTHNEKKVRERNNTYIWIYN